ncbi:MAG: FkbM family methyltransferase [Geminicoccaceae bacterium]|nr:FkbM family methyltransferase [Geminicoccaceae bacterium]
MARAWRRLALEAGRGLAYALVPRLAAARAFTRRRRAGLFDPEIELVPALLDPDRLAVDVGANAGFWTLAMARRAHRVLAIEPIPEIAAELARRVPAHVEVRVCALSDRSGSALLRIPEDAGRATIEESNPLRDGPAARSLAVPVARLDELPLEAPVGLVKIDVEGHEAAVCRGAARVLATDRPALVVEAEERHRPGAVGELRALLEAAGYRGFFLGPGGLEPIARFEPHRHQPVDRSGRPAPGSEGYLNNFLFVPPERVARLEAAAAALARPRTRAAGEA